VRRYFVAGNWKMNLTSGPARNLASAIASGVPETLADVDVLVCPPFPYLSDVVQAVAGSGVRVGAQNVWHEPPGAYTGEVAIEMLQDVGCTSVIVGHSERRHVLGEKDELITSKVRAVCEKGLQTILCVGELLEEREADQTVQVLDTQMERALAGVSPESMARVVIAYEPVWAIGTGRTASPDQAQEAHAHLRKWLTGRYNADVAATTQILYGGSVKPDNARELLSEPDVDGALVGGASLKADSFLDIVEAAVKVAGS
jgi:triosephosphate isomerase (TIM)